MSIVVWADGHLATDRAASDGETQWDTIKAWYHKGEILSGVGLLTNILWVREWYKTGANPETYPPCQYRPLYCEFLVVDTDGLRRYAQCPVPIEHGFEHCAFGVGKQIAFGALGMGASAEQAVDIVNQYSPYCGLGVNIYTLEGDK